MADRGRSNMGRNTGITDPFYIDNGASPFIPRGYSKVANYYCDWKDTAYTGNLQQPGSDTATKIEIVRQGDALGATQLWVTISALSTASGSPSYKRFIDYIGYGIIRELLIQYQSYQIQKIYGNVMHARDQMLFRHYRDRNMIAFNVKGEQTPGMRNSNAAASQTLVIDLPVHWSNELYNRQDRYLLFIGLPHPVEIYVTLPAVAAVCQYDAGTVSWTVTDMKIRGKWYYFTERERQKLTAMLSSPGISYKVC